MWKEIKENYQAGWRFAIAMPLIFALPVTVEAVQHVIEWQIGMFDDLQSSEAVAAHPARMIFGYIKTAVLFVFAYWVFRFLAFDGDRAKVVRFDRLAAGLFALVLAFEAGMVIVQGQVGSLLAMAFPTPSTLLLLGFAAFFLAMLLELYLAAWKVGAALGNRDMGVRASIRTMHRHLGWSYAFTLLMFFPVMILHYALNGFAIGQSSSVAWTMLAFDSLLVGYLAVLLPATVFIVARRAASRTGTDLTVGRRLQPIAV